MQLIEIYRSPLLAACEQRAFVLQAVGIPFELAPHDNGFSLWVATDTAPAAQHHLERYAAESALAPPRQSRPVLYPHAWIAPGLYAVLLIGIAFFAGRATGNIDWYAAGSLLPNMQAHGEWWRAATALTLHTDHAHLLGNLGFGIYFTYLAARHLGWGVALLGSLLAAIAGNILDSILMPASHISIGASTWVFAALGVLAAYSWRRQFDGRLKWTHRWAPLIAGVMLLGMIGAGGENTDVLAHLTGFACGVVIGAASVRLRAKILAHTGLQALGALGAVTALLGAWAFAIP